MHAMVGNSSRTLLLYIWHLESSEISENSDSSHCTQEQSCLQDSATVSVSNMHYLGFGGPCVCAVFAFVGFSNSICLLITLAANNFLSSVVKSFDFLTEPKYYSSI